MFCIPKILKNESNSQPALPYIQLENGCFVSQRYWKMKAIHNCLKRAIKPIIVVLYPKDTEKWKQFTTNGFANSNVIQLFCIPKILKNESNSQQEKGLIYANYCCFVSQRYWKMKAIHNVYQLRLFIKDVVLYPKDTEKWKQFTTICFCKLIYFLLFCIPKILKNESNSQRSSLNAFHLRCCFVSQRYWKMKAIHNQGLMFDLKRCVVLYPKDTEKWKQFTTKMAENKNSFMLFCIPKILKNESNSQLIFVSF